MSYTLIPYLVDLAALGAAVGGGDERLLAEVIAGDPERLGPREPEVEEEELALGTALRHLVMGERPDPSASHQYGYALEQLCRHLGERIGADLWESIRWEVLEDTGFDELFEKCGPPVPIPNPDDGFPRVGHLTAEQVREILTRSGPARLTTAAPSGRKPGRSLRSRVVGGLFRALLGRFLAPRDPLTDEERGEMLEEYKEWLRRADAEGRALVFFYY